MKIGEIIREIREAQKATLESIALAADTNASNLSRIERGTQGYSPETLERIAAALGLTVSELHRRTEKASKMLGAGKKGRDSGTDMVATKFATLTPDNQELVDDFMTLLLRRQRAVKS